VQSFRFYKVEVNKSDKYVFSLQKEISISKSTDDDERSFLQLINSVTIQNGAGIIVNASARVSLLRGAKKTWKRCVHLPSAGGNIARSNFCARFFPLMHSLQFIKQWRTIIWWQERCTLIISVSVSFKFPHGLTSGVFSSYRKTRIRLRATSHSYLRIAKWNSSTNVEQQHRKCNNNRDSFGRNNCHGCCTEFRKIFWSSNLARSQSSMAGNDTGCEGAKVTFGGTPTATIGGVFTKYSWLPQLNIDWLTEELKRDFGALQQTTPSLRGNWW